MTEICATVVFADWIDNLRDRRTAPRILARVDRLALGNPGDVKPVGGGVSELRIDYGPGYRVYLAQRGDAIVILPCVDKNMQHRDIHRAQALNRQERPR